MDDVAIRVSNLGKQYKIGARRQRADTLRDALAGAVKGALSGFSRNGRHADDNTIWALKDISFDVKRGEVLGVIGRNGAGKSTLLKILSRITEPTTGEVDLHGRVGSLLEVGTGFHAELSGRENIYLNGAIIGMKRREIQRQFDEIVNFSGVEQFIDTPVKHYSSGMYMRLAFAVAAHMETEILLIDEVLAVGDAEFQKKCLGKMGEVARAGRTVLFVSHNLGVVRTLCQTVVCLVGGRISAMGPSAEVIEQYMQVTDSLLQSDIRTRTDRDGSGQLRFVNISYLDVNLRDVGFLYPGQLCHILLAVEAREVGLTNIKVGVGIDDLDGNRVATLYSDMTGESFNFINQESRLLCTIPELNLRPDTYLVSLLLGNQFGVCDYVVHAAKLEIRPATFYKSGAFPDRSQGPMLVRHNWSLQ